MLELGLLDRHSREEAPVAFTLYTRGGRHCLSKITAHLTTSYEFPTQFLRVLRYHLPTQSRPPESQELAVNTPDKALSNLCLQTVYKNTWHRSECSTSSQKQKARRRTCSSGLGELPQNCPLRISAARPDLGPPYLPAVHIPSGAHPSCAAKTSAGATKQAKPRLLASCLAAF